MNSKRNLTLVLLALIAFLPGESIAIEAILRVNAPKSDLDRSVGSHLHLEIIVKGDEENNDIPWTVEFKSPRRWLTHGPLLVDAYSVGDRKDRLSKIGIDSIILSAGNLEIPSFHIRKEGEAEIFETNTVRLTSKSNFKSKEEMKKSPPRWLVEPFEHGGFNSMVLGFFSALLLALFAWLAFILFKHIKKRLNKKGPTAKQIADIEILKLRALSRDTSENAEFSKNFSYAVSNTLRTYLAKRLDMPLLGSTDVELLELLQKRAFQPEQIKKCKSILDSTFFERYYNSESLDRESGRRIINSLSEIIKNVEEDFDSPTKKILVGGKK